MIKEKIIQDLACEDFSVDNLADVPSDFSGDYSLPCFSLAKKYSKNPSVIAKEIVDNFTPKGIIAKLENMGPYINITLDRAKCMQIDDIKMQFNDFEGKVACIDFSSINLAKHPHIGHLCTTIIGACIARLLEKVGYKVVRINYLGDYGTPFGKLITAVKKWGNRAEIEKVGVDALQDLYVRFNMEESEELLQEAREWFKRVEQKDAEAVEIYKWIINLSLKEMNKIYDEIGISFDDFNGESYYEGKKDDVIQLLKDKGLVFESEGALLVDLGQYGLGDFMVQKSDGTSLYSTRDIAAAIDRKEKYKFDISLYVTDTAQNLHFKSLFKTLELMGFEWAKDMKHIGYGRLSTPEGKIASRRGKVAVLKDIFEIAENKAYEIVKERNLDKKVATDIGVSAISFGLLKTERVKDAVFDIESALNFEGETSVYLQYTVARINAIFVKAKESGINFECECVWQYVATDDEFEVIKQIDLYKEMIFSAYKDFEPCYIARYAIKLATLFNKFYTTSKIVGEDECATKFRLYLCDKTRAILVDCMQLLGVKILEKM
ncbi:MAG: arginine--tRNA ligase [Christensenellales bacterium]